MLRSFLRENVFVIRNASYIPRKKSYYDILGLKRDCSAEEVRAAFIQLSKQLHPDQASSSEADSRLGWSRRSPTEKFMEVKEAYDVLRRPEKRKQYDALRFDSADGFLKEVSPDKTKEPTVLDLNKERNERYMGPGKRGQDAKHFRDPAVEMDKERTRNRLLVVLASIALLGVFSNIGYVSYLKDSGQRKVV